MRTGGRAANLRALLTSAGLRVVPAPPPPRLADLGPLAGEIESLYRELGGTHGAPPLRPGAWDLAFHGGLVVELDEELHFNRYRRSTLQPSWTAELPWRTDYVSYCDEHEPACLAAARWGARWTNESCERLFGPGAAPADFTGGGAPRWKQRALYDALKDAAAAAGAVRLARIATVDVVGGVRLGEVLAGRASVAADLVAEHVTRRVAG